MRKELQDELNRLNELYQQYDLELRKSGGTDMQRQQMRDAMNRKKKELISQMGDDLQKINIGKSKAIEGGTLTRNLKDMGEGLDAMTIPKIGKGIESSKLAKMIGKKALGGIPFIGGIAQAISSEDASAAIPGLGDAESVGQSSQDEDMMLADIQAKKDYQSSPARMAKLQALMGRVPASESQTSDKSMQELYNKEAAMNPYEKPRMDDPEEKLKAYRDVGVGKQAEMERLRKKQGF